MNSAEQSTACKWNRIYQNKKAAETAKLLTDHRHLLPETGTTLDLACGLGAEALFLASLGLESHAWDISSVALGHLIAQADHQNLRLHPRQLFLPDQLTFDTRFDVIVVNRFLIRALCPSIMKLLKPKGLLFYQTFHQQKRDQTGPSNPDYLLSRNELLELFADLSLVYYREEALIGDHSIGERNLAQLIAQKN